MAGREGYVKVFRSFLDWERYDDEACVRLFIHLLMIVNWRESKWHGRTLPAGSKIISQLEVATSLGWTRQKMGRTLDKLKATGEVTTEAGSKWTLVTLVNWDKYQSPDDQSGHQPGTKRARSGHQPGTEEEGKKLRREETPNGVRRGASIEERKVDFVAKCKAVVSADPDRLPQKDRKAFLDYWTVLNRAGTKMRFESQDYFDHGLRMDRWRKNNEKEGFEPAEKKSTIKPWIA